MRSFFKVSLSIATLLLVCHAMLHAQTIVPTQTDEIIIDNGASGKADPGDRIRYKVIIQNTGGPNGTNTQLNVVPDPRTTFAAGTFKSSPLALPDAYTCTGNVPIFVAAPGVKGNDFDEGAPASLSITIATNQATLRGGSVDIFADGSFEYTPPAGYEGDDSFTYTLNDATQAGPGAPVTDVGTVTITISGMIWFINNAAAAGDGRLSSPFNSLGAFNTANGGMTMNNGDVVNPEVNETIFLYTGGGNYTGGITLLTGQRLFGQGASTANLGTLTGITFNPNSLTLPMAGGTRPVITNAAGDGILLGSGNTVRGLNIGVCSDFGIDDNGTVGTLTISEVDINTTGGGFRTDNGGTLAVTLGAVTAGGIRGIHLAGTAGSFSVSGATTTSGTVNQGIWIDNTSTNVSFAAITISSTGSGSNAFELSGNSGTFNASGTTTINAPVAGGSVSLLVSGGTGGITFANIDINGRRDIGFHISGGSRDITTGTLDIDNSNSVASANAFQTSNVTGGTMSFGATTINANATNSHCMSINNTAAAITFAAGSAVNNSNVSEIEIVGGNGNVTYNGTVNSTAGQAVAVGVHTGGTVEFTGNITANGGNTGILLSQNSGGTIIFSGASKSLTSLTTVGVSMFNCIGTTVNFTNGGLVINNTTATGFQATSGGTLTVQGTGNTINSGTATALIVINTNIGAGNLNFQSISSNGGTAAGIILNNTGTIGGLVVSGDGSNTTKGGNASGGTIANKSDGGTNDSGSVGTAIFLNNTSNVVLRRMQINDCQNFGIRGLDVGNFTFQYSTINGSNGNTSVGTEDCIGFGTSLPAGANGLKNGATVLIDNSIIRGGIEHNVEFYNIANTFSATISNCNITNNSLASGGDGIQIELHTDSNAGTAAANGTFSIQNCFFDDNKSQPLQAAANGDSFIDITINNCIVQKTTQGNEGFVLSNGTDGDMVAHVTNNMITGVGGAAIFVGQTPGNATANSSLTAVISGNMIVHPTTATNSAILVLLTSCDGGFCPLQAATANILIDNNMVTQNSTGGASRGILVDTPDNSTMPSFTATVTNNTVSVQDNANGVTGIVVQARKSSTGCFDVRNNTVTFPNGTPGGVFGLRVRQSDSGTANLEQGISSGVAAGVLAANNPGSTTEVLGTVNVVANNFCQTPPN